MAGLTADDDALLRNLWHGTHDGRWRWLRSWDPGGGSVGKLVTLGLVEMRNARSLEYRITDAGKAEAREHFLAGPCACGHTNMAGCSCGSQGTW